MKRRRDVCPDRPTPASELITELHVWIATFDDGSERVITGDTPTPNGLSVRHMPLMSPRRVVAEGMERMARRAQRAAALLVGSRITAIRLITYRRS